MKKLWYLCCLLLLLINSSLAQQTKITGTLKDSDGKPIESATVQVKGKTFESSVHPSSVSGGFVAFRS